jgi:hypothetical protein
MSGDDANREVGRYICSRYGCHLVSEVPTEMGAMCREHASPLLFEIQYPYRYVGPGPRFVPWEFVKPHERQARSNHGGQTLARLSERGGLSVRELLVVVRDQEWSPPSEYMDHAVAVAQLEGELERWRGGLKSDSGA